MSTRPDTLRSTIAEAAVAQEARREAVRLVNCAADSNLLDVEGLLLKALDLHIKQIRARCAVDEAHRTRTAPPGAEAVIAAPALAVPEAKQAAVIAAPAPAGTGPAAGNAPAAEAAVAAPALAVLETKQAAAPAAPAPAGTGAAAGDAFFDFAALLETVSSGAIAPIRASFVIELHNSGQRISRRQDLPSRAFWTAKDLSALLERLRATFGHEEGSERFGLLCVALSYRWLHPDACDPDGFHLRVVAETARLYLATSLRGRVFMPLEDDDAKPDFALFWDFASLFQKPRSEAEVPLFGLGLRGSNVWYGHALTVTWMQSQLPDGFSGTTYADSGWCYVEASLSSVLKAADRRLDLGRRDAECKKYASLAKVCGRGSGPPLTPERVANQLREEKTFTSPSTDTELVVSLYERFFEAVAPVATQLSIHGPGGDDWGNEQVERMRTSLPRFAACRHLCLVDPPLTFAGARRILMALPAALEHLEVQHGYPLPVRMLSGPAAWTIINFHPDSKGDGYFAKMYPCPEGVSICSSRKVLLDAISGIFIAALLADNRVTTDINLGQNHLFRRGGLAIAEMLRVNNTLRKLRMEDTGVGDEAALAIADALRVNTGLRDLRIKGNGLTEAVCEPVRQALALRATELSSDDARFTKPDCKG